MFYVIGKIIYKRVGSNKTLTMFIVYIYFAYIH